MKIKEGFVLRTICGQNVISGEGTKNVNYSKLVSLNDSAAYLFKAVGNEEFTPERLADLLLPSLFAYVRAGSALVRLLAPEISGSA